jgi:hypothetical protein
MADLGFDDLGFFNGFADKPSFKQDQVDEPNPQ